MYKAEKTITLVTIASPINSNLALLDVEESMCADSLAVVNGGYVNVIPILNPMRRAKYVPITTGEQRGKERITEIKWVKIGDESLFIVLSTIGLQIYDAEVCEVRYFHCCKESGDNLSYTKGVCLIKSEILCVGTNLGTVWMFKGNESNSDFSVIGRFYAHDEAVSYLDGCGGFMVTTSVAMTYVWNVHHDIQISHRIKVPGLLSVPSILKVYGIQCFIGYESGEFCIFELLDEHFCLRVLGHKLKITAIDFSPIRYLVLTASEDCFLKVWSYNQKNIQVECVYTLFNVEGPLCGALFLNLNGSEFCTVTAHDLNIHFYQKASEPEKDGRTNI